MNKWSSAIDASGLAVDRGKHHVLHDLRVTIPAGSLVGLLGPSGSGKTTLLRTIVGTQRITAGSLTVLGRPAGHAQLRRQIGYMTQSPAVYEDLTVEQNVRYFAKVRGSSTAEADAALAEVDLADFGTSYAGRLSGGQLNRVSLAIALVGHPPLIVLDEPTVGLDPVLRRDLWELFQRTVRDGTTVIVSSHVMDEARRCDRLLLMRKGQIIADDTPAGILATTDTTDYDDAFLALVEQAAA